MKGGNAHCLWESLDREPRQGQAGFGQGRQGLGHSWDHPGAGNSLGVGSNKALGAPRLFGDKEGLSSAGDKFVVVFWDRENMWVLEQGLGCSDPAWCLYPKQGGCWASAELS